MPKIEENLTTQSDNGLKELSFSKLSAVRAVPSAEIIRAAHIFAILETHDKQGEERKTIRQFVDEQHVLSDGLLKEYVCGFGNHGLAVINRFISKQSSADQSMFSTALEEARKLYMA